MGYFAENAGKKISNIPIDIVGVNEKSNAYLLTLSIFQKDFRASKFWIKSLSFSVIYFLSQEDMSTVLKQSNYEYEKFCQLKDQS